MKIQNNITLSSCRQEEGIEILRLAGYDVKVLDRTFSIWKDGKKIMGFSTLKYLTQPHYLMKNVVQYLATSKGIDTGRKMVQTEMKNLLDL